MITLELFKTEVERLESHCKKMQIEIRNLLDALESDESIQTSAWDFDQSGDRINDKFE